MTLFMTDFTNSVSTSFQVRQGWQRCRVHDTDFSNIGGTGDWDITAFTRLRFKLNARAGITHDCYIRNLSYMGQSKATVCIQFDDNGLNNYEIAYPLMMARQMPGSCAVISASIGLTNWNGYDRMTFSQMRQMKLSGWDFVNHTHNHQLNVLPTATQAICYQEIIDCRTHLVTGGLCNGISEYLFCAPYGEYGTNYWAAAAQAGMKVFRGTVGDNGGTPSIAESDALLGSDVQVPTLYITDIRTPAYVLAQIDALIRRGGFLILLFHHIKETSASSVEYTTANFTTILDGLVARRSSLDVVNMSTMYERHRL